LQHSMSGKAQALYFAKPRGLFRTHRRTRLGRPLARLGLLSFDRLALPSSRHRTIIVPRLPVPPACAGLLFLGRNDRSVCTADIARCRGVFQKRISIEYFVQGIGFCGYNSTAFALMSQSLRPPFEGEAEVESSFRAPLNRPTVQIQIAASLHASR
jgi:hypothetical protein